MPLDPWNIHLFPSGSGRTTRSSANLQQQDHDQISMSSAMPPEDHIMSMSMSNHSAHNSQSYSDVCRNLTCDANATDTSNTQHETTPMPTDLRGMPLRALLRLVEEATIHQSQGAQEQVQQLQQALEEQRKENKGLKQDMVELKRQVASLSTLPNQVADDRLKEQLDDIYLQTAAWVKTHFRKHKQCELCDGFPCGALLRQSGPTKPKLSSSTVKLLRQDGIDLEDYEGTARLKLAQAIIGGKLNRILQTFYFGTDRDGTAGSIADIAFARHKEENASSETLSYCATAYANIAIVGVEFEEWRARTAGLLSSMNYPVLSDSADVRALGLAEDLDLCISEIFDAPDDDERLAQLLALVQKTIKFNWLFRSQRVHYTVGMPKPSSGRTMIFNPATMEDLGDVEDSSRSKKLVSFFIFPYFAKVTDEPGQVRCLNSLSPPLAHLLYRTTAPSTS